ncbi:MAG: GWxTD domain-containing protein [Candidatus Krumholzibacteriia bacterium]
MLQQSRNQRLVGCALTVLAWTAGAGTTARAAPETTLASSLHPGVGRGDFEFHVDAAGLHRAGAGKVVARVLVQLPVRQVLEETRANEADLRVRVGVYEADAVFAAFEKLTSSRDESQDGRSPRRDALESDRHVQELLEHFGGIDALTETAKRSRVEVAAREQLRDTDYKLIEVPLEIAPGDYVFEVVVENLSRHKRGLLDKLRKRPMSATSRMLVRIPDLHRMPALGDPVFQSGYLEHADYASRVYGLLNDSLHVRTTVFAEGPTRLRVVARDRSGEEHWRDSLEVRVSGSREIGFHASVNTFPAGQYTLALTAESPQGSVVSSRSFDVAWSLSSWKKSRRDLGLEAEIVLLEEEYEVYSSLPLGEKERYMDAFWAEQDPTPETAYNDVLAEFHRRVAHADFHFSEAVRGALSDRGKVYIRFGPPQEVQHEAVPGHLAGEGAEELIEKVEDPYSSSEHEIVGLGSGTGEVRGQRERLRLTEEHDRVVGRARELVGYELWIYTGGGSPLLPRDASLGIRTGLRLLFVDSQGFGEYQLRKASAQLDIPGLRPSY